VKPASLIFHDPPPATHMLPKPMRRPLVRVETEGYRTYLDLLAIIPRPPQRRPAAVAPQPRSASPLARQAERHVLPIPRR
jgi:hypothetical protein